MPLGRLWCPAGHVLEKRSHTKKKLGCDLPGCGQWIKRGETHDRCDECDFDVCNSMHQLPAPGGQNNGDEPCNSPPIPPQEPATPPPPTPQERIAALEAEVAGLKTTLRSVRASGARATSTKGKTPATPVPEPTAAQESKNRYERVRVVCIDHLEPILEKRPGLRAHILNRLILSTPVEERKLLSTLQAMEQERYLGIDGAVKTIRLHGYNAVHSADLVVNEHLSVGTTRNINDRFTQMADEDGFAKTIELCRPPTYVADPDGEEINMLTQACNRSLGIYSRVIYCPKPFRTDKEIHDAIYATFGDRELHMTLPTRDGYEGATFDIVKAARDVLRQAAIDNNLRALAHGRKRRLQVVFDKLRWSNGKSMTRWNLRTPDTVRDHNSTRYGRDMMNYEGDDSHAWLTKSVRLH